MHKKEKAGVDNKHSVAVDISQHGLKKNVVPSSMIPQLAPANTYTLNSLCEYMKSGLCNYFATFLSSLPFLHSTHIKCFGVA